MTDWGGGITIAVLGTHLFTGSGEEVVPFPWPGVHSKFSVLIP